jgi:superfamily I DNA and/or RNA helicase
MHPAIGQMISDCFYGGTLTSEPRDLSAAIEMAFGSAVLWLDTIARGDRSEVPDGTTYRNRGEARVVRQLLDRLQWVASRQDEHLSVVVLTAYEAQRRELTDVIVPGELNRPALTVRVANVDAYQGQEADVAVFSVTRSNDEGNLGFLRSENRINVALSRAREGLVIVGDTSYIDAARGDINPLKRVLTFIRATSDSSRLELAGQT